MCLDSKWSFSDIKHFEMADVLCSLDSWFHRLLPREDILTPHPQPLDVDEVMARRSFLGISHQRQTASYSNSRCLQGSWVHTSMSPTGRGLDRPNLRWYSALDRYRPLRRPGDWPASKRVVAAAMSSPSRPACS
jgi:hypothetical protein